LGRLGKAGDFHSEIGSERVRLTMRETTSGLKVWIRGIVQGVGFRPFIFNLAEQHGLTGWVKNTSNGVEIIVNGPSEVLQQFVVDIRSGLPPLARIDDLRVEPSVENGFSSFEILESQPQPGAYLPISPDVAVCADCRRELFDPTDRRYRYPFINCTNCGPRFSIIRDIPYDRPNTTMADFPLCPQCREEYQNPRDRRFHAQPIACSNCGPHLWLETAGEQTTQGEQALQTARELLKAGKIIAIKGLGGFHLACDAGNPAAAAELRRRKKRSDKPFALMAFDLNSIRKHCLVTPTEADLLESRQAPVVLLSQRTDSTLAAELAPGQNTLGFMLPYTPLHLLLLEPGGDFPEVLVMTSGNLSEEPIAYRDEDARQRLNELADGFLMHNRPIHMRVDDPVIRAALEQPYPIRRARGYAPDPLALSMDVPPLLAAGPELKNTFCLARDRYAFLSHHIGDMENYETLRSYEEGIRHFERLFRVKPQWIACDMHPNYLATRYAQQRAQEENLPLIMIQHHHAHLAACLADNGWTSPEPVIGLSFDGTGYGTDGAIWGSEVLLGGYKDYQRRFHLTYVPLPGGDAAVRKPARMALAHLWAAGMEWEADLPPALELCSEERTVLKMQLEKRINAPLTSSMGRFFDAASALIGIRQTATYEGQAAVELEALADPLETGLYPFEMQDENIDPAPLWHALLSDWRAGTSTPQLAARFHNSIARLAVDLCKQIRRESGSRVVALSGGVWLNRFLLERTVKALRQQDFRVLVHRQVPTNDGGIALGQVMAAAYQMIKE
jgi:hydrogenase maturation protein HypF